MTSPAKLAHVALKTNDMAASRTWFLAVLDAHVVFENDMLCFMTYDDEHHRLVLANDPEFELQTASNGIHHLSFTYETLNDLLEHYESLKARGITPHLNINHGPTMSMYYLDPMGNQIELQIDTMTADEAMAFINSEVFRHNPIGIQFDPDDISRRHKQGEPAESLWAYNP